MKVLKIAIILFSASCLIPLSILTAQSEQAFNIFEQHNESLVSFVTFGEDKSELSRGTGFLIGREVMITAYHLVSQAKDAEGRDFKGKKVKVEGIIHFDKYLDIAVVKVNRKDPVLTVGNSDDLGIGEDVYALGAKESGDLGVFQGTVQGLLEYAPNQRIVDIDILASESLCGGPVLDASGKVLGMLIYLDTRTRFVLPANRFKNLPLAGSPKKFKDQIPEDYFSTFEGSYFAGRLYVALDDTGKAEKYLKEVVKQKPEELDAHILLAAVFSKQRNYNSAVSAYQKIIELNPGQDSAHLGLGIVYLKMMRYKEAIPPLEKAIQLNMDNQEAYFNIGNAHEELREFDKAAAAYEKYLAANPLDAGTANQRLGLCYLELEKYEEAISALKKALEVNPSDIQMNYKLGQAFQKAGQYENAEVVFLLLAQLTPEDAKVYYNNIIMMYDQVNMPEKAIASATKLTELEPNNADAMYNLGYMYIKLKQYPQAIQAFNKALEIRPDMEYAYLQIASAHFQQEQWKDLIVICQRLVEVFPENADGWQNIGIGLMQLKRFGEAIEPLQKTIDIKPDNGIAYYNLGICYLNLHNKDRAIEIWKKLKTIDAGLAQRLYNLIAR